MSAALINRSLMNVRTELEFLYDSEVIDKALLDALMESVPRKYTMDMAPWGVDKIPGGSSGNKTGADPKESGASTEALSGSLQTTSLGDTLSRPALPQAAVPVPERAPAPALGYCKASYSYESSESGDLRLVKGDLLAVLEHLSPDWWKGYKKGSTPALAGVFPSNYVVVVSESEFNASAGPETRLVSLPEKAQEHNEKASYELEPNSSAVAPPVYQQANPQNGVYQAGYQPSYSSPPPQQQPSYGGFAQFPPPPTNYYGQPPMQAPQPQQQVASQAPAANNGANHLKKFGSKLGNAAIFGAGATVGGNIVNLIF